MVLLKEFDVFLGNIKSDPQNTSQSRHWRVACCRNWRSKKWIYHCKKGVELDIWEAVFFLVFFGRHRVWVAKRRSKSTVESAMFGNPSFFCYFENGKVKLENEKVWKCLMKLMFFGATAICICKRQYKVEKGVRGKMGPGLRPQRFTERSWRF